MAVDPGGFVHLESFALRDGVPCWRWSLGGVVLERQVAMAHRRPVVAVRALGWPALLVLPRALTPVAARVCRARVRPTP